MTALINDTTGTLIASNYVDPNTKIAVIFGTGCNAAYMEHAGNIPKMDGLGLPADQEMAINVSPCRRPRSSLRGDSDRLSDGPMTV
jgi:hexokinase